MNKHPNNISWPDVVFLAEAEREEFADVQIITLYSHCLNIAEERGVHISEISESEQAEVFRDRVLVVVDVDTIDDETTMTALDLLTEFDNFEVGTKKEFGPKKTFKYKKVH